MSEAYQYYYSGSQVMAYIGGRYLDEMNAIAFNYEISMVPRYHYTHRHPMAIRHGRAYVEGELRLNYVHPMYIQLYLLQASGAMTAEEATAQIAALYSRDTIEGVPILGRSPYSDVVDDQYAGAFQEALNRDLDGMDMTPDEFSESQSNEAAFVQNAKEFEELHSLYINKKAGENLSRKDVDTALYWGTGDPASPDPASKGQRSLDGYSAIDIVLNIGQGESRASRVIKGCKFSGPQIIVNADANPIAEIYRFVGQSFA